MENNPWIIQSEKIVYKNPWIQLIEYGVLNPSGKQGIYGKVHFKNVAVGVVVLDEEMHTWLVGQYRFPLQQYSWEIPEGGAPVGTDTLLTAQRELKEETGFVAANWQQLLTMHLSNSVSDELAIVYLATELTPGPSEPEETELLQLKRIPLQTAFDWVENGTITDSISVAAFLKLQLQLQQTGKK
ncbi:MAG: NUDIX hydrolase [Chitinophagia bacterium]|nr:NUDIX hydrolase [Chitinophagia bacterium]